MSLEEAPEPSLDEMKGRLEVIESEWILAADQERRRKLNAEFKALADEIKQRFGEEGKKVVDSVVAKHMALRQFRK
ncbi:MAG: hypothetical protein QXR69_03615 [Conexivisphaerales archaeon]